MYQTPAWRKECRSPCGERGLKYRGRVDLVALRQSLPVRGAWIEIDSAEVVGVLQHRRSPCGERGLKCPRILCLHYRSCRSPCGERGLKCAMWKVVSGTKTSLPVRGAWIEIVPRTSTGYVRRGRSPCGERGLKLRCRYSGFSEAVVAPRAGSVD